MLSQSVCGPSITRHLMFRVPRKARAMFFFFFFFFFFQGLAPPWFGSPFGDFLRFWSSNPRVPWSSLVPGPLVPWSSGPLVPWSWSPGPLVPWCPGPLVLWSSGPLVLVPWSSGPLVLWSPGPLVPGPLVPWSWSCGPLVPWSSGLSILWSLVAVFGRMEIHDICGFESLRLLRSQETANTVFADLERLRMLQITAL